MEVFPFNYVKIFYIFADVYGTKTIESLYIVIFGI